MDNKCFELKTKNSNIKKINHAGKNYSSSHILLLIGKLKKWNEKFNYMYMYEYVIITYYTHIHIVMYSLSIHTYIYDVVN